MGKKLKSPGHKLGQILGGFLEGLFIDDFKALANQYGFYLDSKGLRPNVRGRRKKVTWKDHDGNSHDLDYVFEKGGTYDRKGIPVAFIEATWRRYTKHSRNKAGEIEGALLPLRDSYPSCRFIGAMLAGEYTGGGKNQLTSHGFYVFHILFEHFLDAFKKRRIDLDYPEKADDKLKLSIIQQWESLSPKAIDDIKMHLRKSVAEDYSVFRKALETSLISKIESVIILPLYGTELSFDSVKVAMKTLVELEESKSGIAKFVKYEIQIRYYTGSFATGAFYSKEEALEYLQLFV